MGAVLSAATVSGLIPLLRCVKYASLRARVILPMEINTNSLRCSMVFAAAFVILELKAIKYCNLSMAANTFEEIFSFTLSMYSLQLTLHVLLYLKKAPVKAGSLVADYCGFPG